MARVSVIIPAYNAGLYVKEAIESVLSQTYSDIELIAVDDASTDRTGEIIKTFGSRVNYMHHDANMGPSAARNTGIKHARGEYIAFLDADDAWMPDKIEKQIRLFENNSGIGLVYSDGYNISASGLEAGRFFEIAKPHRGFAFNKLILDNFIPTSTVVIRRRIINEAGYFDGRFSVSQDFELYLRISERYEIDFVNEPLAKHMINPEGISSKHRNVLLNDAIAITKYYRHKISFSEPRLAGELDKKITKYMFYLAIWSLINAGRREGIKKYLACIKNGRFDCKILLGGIFFIMPRFVSFPLMRKFIKIQGGVHKNNTGICMVVGAFYPDISGGAVQCLNLIDSLKQDFDFYVIATYKISSKKRGIKNIFTEEVINGFKVFRINLHPSSIISEALSLLAIFIIFFKIKGKVSVFHMHGYTRKGYIVTILAKIFGKRIIIKTTSFGIDDPLSIKKIGIMPFALYSLADAYVLTSPAQKESHKLSGLREDKAFMIPNGVNLSRFNIPAPEEKICLRQEMGIPDSFEVILSVSFFSEDKGIDMFAESLLLLPPDKLKDLFLIFIGSKDGKELEVDAKIVKKVYNSIDSINIRSRCLFIDKVYEMERYFKVSDIFILPSKREGLPNALLEAMASGLCCIASKLEGATDYIIDSQKEGYLLNALNPASIADILKNIIGDKGLQHRIGFEAHSKIRRMFDMERIKDNYAKLYNHITGSVV